MSQYIEIPNLSNPTQSAGGGGGGGGITSINSDTTAAQTITAGNNISPISTSAGNTIIATSASPIFTNETVNQQFLCNGAITSTSAIVAAGWTGSGNLFGYQFGGANVTYPGITSFTCSGSRFSWSTGGTLLAQLDLSHSALWVASAGQPGNPCFSFTGDNQSGLYQRSPGNASLAAGGNEVLRIDSGNNTSLAMLGSSLAVTATSGFVYLPATSGTPTGAPATTYNGGIPIVLSSSTNSLFLYNNGWKSVSGGGGGGSGTVTSIALASSSPSIFNISGSPITTSGTITLQETIQSSGVVLAGPISGTQSVAPSFRQLSATDIPSLSYLPLSGGTMSGNISMGSSAQMVNMIDPINPQDAATKNYVDTVAAGLSVYGGVTAATTTTLNATYFNGVAGIGATLTNAGSLVAFSIDGVSPTQGQLVLIKNQSSTFQNGIYNVTTVGSGAAAWVLTRALDYDQAPKEIFPGNLVFVVNGTANGNTSWVQTATVNTIGSDAITFTQFNVAVNTVGSFSGSSQVNGASISGNTITFGPSDITNPGMVSTGTQTWTGQKSFNSTTIFNGDINIRTTSNGDSAFTIPSTANYVGITAITANRLYSLPSTANVNPGHFIWIKDESGQCASTGQIQVQGNNGTDLIDSGTGSKNIVVGFGALRVIQRGSGWWTV